MIKLIVSDLDGTLLNEKHQISDASITAIEAAKHAGITFMFATGRDYQNLKSLLKDFPLEVAMICCNGSLYIDETGTPVFEQLLPLSKVNEIKTIMEPYEKLFLTIISNHGIYSFVDETTHRQDFIGNRKLNEYDRQMLDDYYSRYHQINDLSELPQDSSIYKIECSGDETQKRLLSEILQSDQNISVSYAYGSALEINALYASKGEALERIIKMMHLYPHEVMVIGDSGNDISMFERFPYSFAMANAAAEVRAKASLIANRNTDDGVASAIFKTIARNQNYWTFVK